MGRIRAIVLLLSFAATPALFAQKPPDTAEDKPPAKGDQVIARGCLSGTMLSASETRKAKGSGKLDRGVTYRLTGPRGTLRSLRNEHDGEIVEVTGVLKSDLPDEAGAGRGKQIGKSGIFVGMGGPPRGNSPGDMVQYYPVLEVKSFERATGRCLP
jgi:hypothetical protein